MRGARERDLVSALAKLASPEQPFLLQAMASSFVSLRLARLTMPQPQSGRVASRLLALTFAAVLVMGVFQTVAHTACCFLTKH